ncbi:Uncharacterised protein [Xylophilus ampelinus]|nr:Uncharacterised protein [Xylophilus ampelinus]
MENDVADADCPDCGNTVGYDEWASFFGGQDEHIHCPYCGSQFEVDDIYPLA